MLQLQVKECLGLPEARRGKGEFYPKSFRESSANIMFLYFSSSELRDNTFLLF